jgi:hypothetical protein
MAADFGRCRSWLVILKTSGKTLSLLFLCLCVSREMRAEEEKGMSELAKCIENSEFVAHGLVDTFGSGMDGSLVRIGFYIREMLKGSYTEPKVEFEQLPPAASGGEKAFDLFQKHGHDYILCFKRGAQEGKYEYSGPPLTTPEVTANGANMAKVKRIIRGEALTSWSDTTLSLWLCAIASALLVVAVILTIRQVMRKRREQTKT